MRISNCGVAIQRFAAAILAAAIIIFCLVIVVEAANSGVWDFGSLQELIIMECLILLGGFVIYLLLYGFGEIILHLQRLREIAEDMS